MGTVSDNGQLAGDSVFVVQLHHQSIAHVYGKHHLDTRYMLFQAHRACRTDAVYREIEQILTTIFSSVASFHAGG